ALGPRGPGPGTGLRGFERGVSGPGRRAGLRGCPHAAARHGTIVMRDKDTDGSKTLVMVVLVLAGVAVLAAVVVLATGRGGELARTHPDVPPLPLMSGAPVTGPEVAMLRLPRAFWGYQMNMTDEALHRLAYALTERDARLAAMERQVADLRHRLAESEHAHGPAAGPSGAWALPDEPPATVTDVPAGADPHASDGRAEEFDLFEDDADRPDESPESSEDGHESFPGHPDRDTFGGHTPSAEAGAGEAAERERERPDGEDGRFDGPTGRGSFGGGLFEGRRELLENENPRKL
ncbi:hypothetical protein AB0J52_27315, partial [Spirillospora sp. NPDC049652]